MSRYGWPDPIELQRYLHAFFLKRGVPEQERGDLIQSAVERFYQYFDPDRGKWTALAARVGVHVLSRRADRFRREPYAVEYIESLPPGPRGEHPRREARMPFTPPLQETAARFREGLKQLTEREAEVVALIAEGWMEKEIAALYGVSQQAIHDSKRRAQKKLRAANPSLRTQYKENSHG